MANMYNPDGIGISICKNNKLITRKNVSQDIVFKAISSKFDYVVIHYRLATSGFKASMTHPHFIDEHTIFYHNGIFPGLNGCDKKSDSAKMAEILSMGINNELFELYCQSTRNKAIIIRDLTPKIYNEQAGKWTQKLWDSNGENPLTSKRYFL
jgi:predicted glutamine amidotransferase